LKTKLSSYQEDLEFINATKKNPNHFALLYNKYWDQLFRFIFKKIQNLDDTADVYQLMMLKAMTNILSYKDKGFSFFSLVI
jgi:RNA polymerase sigma-70 factor (ECF subfamily)